MSMCEAFLAPWEMSFNGYRWKDMPGVNEDERKVNFALFRRGLLKLEEVRMEVEILGELPVEVSVPLVDGGWQLSQAGKVKKARVILEARERKESRKKLRIVKPKFGRIVHLIAQGEARKARAVTGEQVALVAEYKRLAGMMNRMDSPRAMMIGAVRKMGGKEGALLAGLEKGKPWSDSMVGWVRGALPVLRAHVAVVEATMGRVRVAMGVYEGKKMPRGLWMVDLTRASGLSDQAVKDFLAGKLSTLRTLRMLEKGLAVVNARGVKGEGRAA